MSNEPITEARTSIYSRIAFLVLFPCDACDAVVNAHANEQYCVHCDLVMP